MIKCITAFTKTMFYSLKVSALSQKFSYNEQKNLGDIIDINNSRVAVVELGYVGPSLMVDFAKKYPTLGFNINNKRIIQLKEYNYCLKSLSEDELSDAIHGSYSSSSAVIIAVVHECLKKFGLDKIREFCNKKSCAI